MGGLTGGVDGRLMGGLMVGLTVGLTVVRLEDDIVSEEMWAAR